MALSKFHFFCGTSHPCELRGVDDFSSSNGTSLIERRGSALSFNFDFRLRSCLNHSNAVFRQQDGWSSKVHAVGQLCQEIRDSRILGEGVDANYVNGLGKPFRFPRQQKLDKIVVAVDVDEVLGSFLLALNKFIADRYSLYHTVSDYHVYEFFRIWNCSPTEAEIRVHQFFKTPYFTSGIDPIPGAHSVLCNLSSFCNLSVVTSRQNVIKDHTCDWIEKYYPGLFKEIHFGNHFALDGTSIPKSEICRSMGAQVLIDDNPRYALECAEAGIRVLLFDYQNSYPWSKTGSADSHRLVTRVHTWEEVEEQLTTETVLQER
ncbi:hypothetical protein HPP92_002097 [Vanilla planifolia]|uniref:Tac7077 n=1 Tax=Vanilla planifolia TaxID=51239 RepID=A0A835S0K2_VANPL|nr:hypothetical protein HPP92_027596 [Vanilla planifolia]KAG0502025.1 hypothetical protein HPP92_002097 [Vanilla planifolia]